MRTLYKYNRETGKVEEVKSTKPRLCADASHGVIRDIDATLPDGGYRHTITGEWVTSRKRHKELLKEHNCVEVGNEKSHFTGKPIS